MQKLLAGGLTLLLLVLVSVVYADEKKYTPIAKTRVSLIVPPGFEASDSFHGLIHGAGGMSVRVEEIARPVKESIKGMDEETLNRQGAELVKKIEIPIADCDDAVLLHLKQSQGGRAFRKWLGIFGNKKETVIITATYPESLDRDWNIPMKLTVRKAHWDPDKKLDPFLNLDFKIEAPSGMKFAKAQGSRLIYTKDGKFPRQTAHDPIVYVTSRTYCDTLPDPGSFCAMQLRQTTELRQVKLKKKESQPIEINGLKGWAHVAHGIDKGSLTDLVAQQVILFDGNGYYRFLGLGDREEKTKWLSKFLEAAKTFRLKKGKNKKSP